MTYKWYKMKKYILLFLVTFQMVFSQEIVVKGKAFNSKEHEHRGVNIVVNDTINRLMDYNLSLYSKFEKKSKFQNSEDDLYLQYEKNAEILKLLEANKKYKTQTDSLGNFEIKAKLSDTLLFNSYRHTTKKYLVADLVKKKKINIKLKLEPCEAWPSHQEKPTKLYVFVGKKIKTWDSPFSNCNNSFNDRTLAKYEVVKNIYGDFNKKTIQFTSYSHEITIPSYSFEDYEYCLLYVLKYKGEFIQIKYLYDDVYLTKEGRWATPLIPKGSLNSISPDQFKPDKIDFLTPFELHYDEKFKKRLKMYFFESYIKIVGSKIEVTHGYYIEDLFEIRKAGRLKEYEIFND
jgi:hypothetical protein